MQSQTRSLGRLLLLRHAHSAWPRPGQKDFDRSLDDTGRREAGRLAELAAAAGLVPDLIVCSPALRCKETAAIFVDAMPVTPAIRYDLALYAETAEHYVNLASTEGHGKSLMIVGHNPMIEETLLRLAGREAAEAFIPGGFPTAGLAVFNSAEPGAWTFETLLAP